ncbi:MAG: zinc transporter ZntB [Halioglobus sp.]
MTNRDSSGPVILAYSFDGNGGGEALSGEAVGLEVGSERFAWVHLDANHSETQSWLESEVSYLDSFIIQALLAEETRPRLMEIGDGALLILRGMNFNAEASHEDMVSIRLWFDGKRVISLEKRPLRVVSDLEQRILASKGPKDAGHFIALMTARLFDQMEPVLLDLSEATDDIEEEVQESASVSLREGIVSVRKKAIMFRRYMAPQRDEIAKLRLSDLECFSDTNKRQLQECLINITRYVEDLDAIRERAQIVKDEIANMLADRLNKNMYVLSVVAAIFLPLGFLTGLLGINVGGIPGADNDQAFWLFIGLLVVIVAMQVAIFRRLKWF